MEVAYLLLGASEPPDGSHMMLSQPLSASLMRMYISPQTSSDDVSDIASHHHHTLSDLASLPPLLYPLEYSHSDIHFISTEISHIHSLFLFRFHLS